MQSSRTTPPRVRAFGALALWLALALTACDPGLPEAEEQMASLGIPPESVLHVNDETQATVHMNGGTAFLLIYRPFSFGGHEANEWPADPSPVGGQVGNGWSQGPEDGAAEPGPGYCYVFGAAQGPVDDVVVSDPAAKAQVVNPAIGGWVVVMPEDEDLAALEWTLVGGDGVAIHSGRGFPGSSYRCAEQSR